MPPTIYLAGPIFGATGPEANDWRNDITARLAFHGINCISPLRCEPRVGERYDVSYKDPCFGTPSAIVGKNMLDVRACDFVLVYMPVPPEMAELNAIVERLDNLGTVAIQMVGADDDDVAQINADAETLARIAKKGVLRSIGTLSEVAWAYALNKPIALVSDDPLMKAHPFPLVQPNWILSNMAEAERLIAGLYGDYTKTPCGL